MNDSEIRPGDIRTNAEWRRLGAIAENRPVIVVCRDEVPERFQWLIPYVERWAIGCDVTRGDYMEKQPKADVDEFYAQVQPHRAAIYEWAFQEPQTDAKDLFIIMLAAHCEAAPPPTNEEIAEMRRKWAEERDAKRKHWRDVINASKAAEAK
ncbi:MAG TPA: hypothetical protein PLB55_09995 [Prosthecobacter sp.]|nr:hypothetical protein [Prosthecobacter sp.]